MKRELSVGDETGRTLFPFVFVIILSCVAAFAFQGTRGLYETTEGRYAEAAREMVETGNYLVPTLDYHPHWTKPPLAYWGIAAGLILFGESEWGIRFSNSVAFLLTIFSVIILGTLLWEPRVGLVAGLVYLSSPFPFFGANAVSTDTMLACWEVLAVLCYVKAYREKEPSGKRTWVTFMWVAFGLGFLTKGPPSLLPLAPVIIWNYTRKNKVNVFAGFGVPLFLLISFSWFVVVTVQHPSLASYFLKTEIVERVSSKAVHNSEWYGPFAVFLPVLIGGQGAWLWFGARGLWRAVCFGPRRFISFMRDNEEVFFLVLWVSLPLLVFSIVQSRLELYVLPLYAPIALLLAFWISRFEATTRKRLFVAATISVLVLAGAKYWISINPNRNNMKQVYEMSLGLGSENPDYYLFQEDKLYGMQYYLKGKMQRVTVGGGEEWADAGIEQLLSSLDGNKRATSYLVLSRTRKVASLDKALSGRDLDVKARGNKHWIWYLISQKSS